MLLLHCHDKLKRAKKQQLFVRWLIVNFLSWMSRYFPRRLLTAYSRGRHAEQEAASYLRRRGYRVVTQNLRTNWGEIDIVAVKKDVVAFVEVKARSSDEFGSPLEVISPRQQNRIRTAAEAFAAKRGWHNHTLRFDLIAVDLDSNGRIIKIEHIEDAF